MANINIPEVFWVLYEKIFIQEVENETESPPCATMELTDQTV